MARTTRNSYADEILARTNSRVELVGKGRADWPFAASLKALSEGTAQQYAGRALLELIQNGHDALSAARPGRIQVLLDAQVEHPALYVANEGTPFVRKDFHGIVDFGRSSKAAGEGIGNKGLGFRSVLQLTDHPEVYSRDPSNPDDDRFSGYSFRYPHDDEMAALTPDPDLAEHIVAEVSPLDLPVPAEPDDDPELLRLAADGFATVIKLPLRDDTAVDEVLRQIDTLEAADAPVLLFLDRVTGLSVHVRSADSTTTSTVLTRIETASKMVSGHPSVREVDLGAQGRYLFNRRTVAVGEFKAAVERSVSKRAVDPRWLEWDDDDEVWVSVAQRLDEDVQVGKAYTFLPMEQDSPLAAHVHAPFFADLARREARPEVPLNAYLMSQIAAACLELMCILRDNGDHLTVAPLVVDLVAWKPPQHQFLQQACTDHGTDLATEKCIPIAGQATWASLQDTFTWPQPPTEQPMSVISPAAVASLGHWILDQAIGAHREANLDRLHKELFGTRMHPGDDSVADWVESVAKSLHTRQVATSTWTDFYTDLTVLFDESSGSALRGRRIILDQRYRLRAAMDEDNTKPAAPVLFIAPSADEDGEEATVATRIPDALARRIVYTHNDIQWAGNKAQNRRSARNLFINAGLARGYGLDQLLELIRNLMRANPSPHIQSAALEYGFALYPNLSTKQRNDLSVIHSLCPPPTAHGGQRGISPSPRHGTRLGGQ